MSFQQVQPRAGTPGVADPAGPPAQAGPAPTSAAAILLPVLLVVGIVVVAKTVFAKREGAVVVANGNAVVVTDVQIPFGSMVVFMVKWALASIPAMIILLIVGAVLGSTMGALLLAIGGMSR